MNSKTLCLKKSAIQAAPFQPSHVAKQQRHEQTLAGKMVVIQGKSPSRWSGTIESFGGGWLIVNGEERRWLTDGLLSDVVCNGRFTIDRSAVGYICEVDHE